MYNHLLFSQSSGIATLTLNRPESYNAINEKISVEIQEVLKIVAKDATIRVLVITGSGKAFCSGQDLKEIPSGDTYSLGETVKRKYNPIIKGITGLEKPVICRLNGIAAGAGCSIALACDLIIASENAVLCEVFINIGLVLDSGSSFFLPRLVGTKKAFEYATLATKISAQEALEMGMVNKVVKENELDATVEEIAKRYAVAPTKAIGMIKKMLNRSFHSTLDEMLESEMWHQEIAGRSEDFKEGVKAFMEKRHPEFRGF